MTTAEHIALLREHRALGLALAPETQQLLNEADAKDAERASIDRAAAAEALSTHERAMADYANIEAGYRRLMAKVIKATDELNEAYEKAHAAARNCRKHGHVAQAPLRIHADQTYEARKLVEAWHATTRSPV